MKHTQTLDTPRLLGIVWPFIAVVGLMAMLGCISLYALSAVRSYVAGESFWSKGQKDAIYYLNLYADSRDEEVFQKYLRAIAIPQGGHQLRLALDQPEPDLAAARSGILKGNNHPDDMQNIIWLYRHFSDVSYMSRAIAHWKIGDTYLVELDALAQQMHAAQQAGTASEADMARWKHQIMLIN
ncbi:MAG: PAS domain S-box protein, partial [Proteobacteria bacterium]